MKYIRLGDLLVKSGTITQGQLDEALALFPENAELRGKLARVEELMEQANRVPPISMDAVTAVDATS